MVLFQGVYKQRIRKISIRPAVCLCITFLVFFIPTEHSTSLQKISSEQYMIPILQWEPKSYDFGYVHEGHLYQTTFDIWNNGSGDMPWLLDVKKPWVSVFPTNGISSGEHDTVSVTINTTGLSPGSYEGNVVIHSEGDYMFYSYFVVTAAKLAFDPLALYIVYNESISTGNSTFKLWNAGLGEISYSLSPSQAWITVFPSSGIIGNLMDTIFVSVDISQQNITNSSEYITIHSTGGNAVLPVFLMKNFPPSIPIISGPEKGGLRKDTFFTISSTDDLSHNISYLVDWGDNSISDWIGPYPSGEVISLNHSWMKRGIYSIRCKARDGYGDQSDWSDPFRISISRQSQFILIQIMLRNLIKI